MIIHITKPPIWDEVHKAFDIDDSETIYTYGDVLHNPANLYIDDHLLAHESIHSEQQRYYDGGPSGWWRRYLVDNVFRLEQEVEAYAAQYRSYCKIEQSRERRIKYLWQLATHLSSPMYKLGISIFMAYGEIKKKV